VALCCSGSSVNVKRTGSLADMERLNAAGVEASLVKDGGLGTSGEMEEVVQRCSGDFISDRQTRSTAGSSRQW
jgi:hypothetical protein